MVQDALVAAWDGLCNGVEKGWKWLTTRERVMDIWDPINEHVCKKGYADALKILELDTLASGLP